mmetsp:Transcript_6428/g.23275  ORF Transcript_6428/g.23275 Transcript_6428/m.23275 type:complete len:253 (-) Transcript_6428:606-1364(-)
MRAAEPKFFTAGLTHNCARPAIAAAATCSSAFATLPPNTVLRNSPITCVNCECVREHRIICCAGRNASSSSRLKSSSSSSSSSSSLNNALKSSRAPSAPESYASTRNSFSSAVCGSIARCVVDVDSIFSRNLFSAFVFSVTRVSAAFALALNSALRAPRRRSTSSASVLRRLVSYSRNQSGSFVSLGFVPAASSSSSSSNFSPRKRALRRSSTHDNAPTSTDNVFPVPVGDSNTPSVFERSAASYTRRMSSI